MSDQTPASLKQSLLDQIDVGKKAMEVLRDEELETVAGGLAFLYHNTAQFGHMNTGAILTPMNTTTGEVSGKNPRYFNFTATVALATDQKN